MRLRPLGVTLTLVGASLWGVGCGTAIHVHVLRPAHFTSPHPNDTVEVIDFAIPERAAPVYGPEFAVDGSQVYGEAARPREAFAVQVGVPDPRAALLAAHQAQGHDVQLVAFVEAHGGVASTLANGLRDTFANSPNQTHMLVPRGGTLIVSGQVTEATYAETIEHRTTECRRTTTDVRGQMREVRTPCFHIVLRWETHIAADLIVRDVQGQVLYTVPFHADDGDVTEGDYEDPHALRGGTADPAVYQGQILATASRVLAAMQRHVVPYWDDFAIEWLDAHDLPTAQQALHDEARSHARDEPALSLALLDELLGGEATPETSEQPLAIARVLANRSGLRLALGQYDEALADMQRANAWLPGCIQAERMSQVQTMVEEQSALRAQGVNASH